MRMGAGTCLTHVLATLAAECQIDWGGGCGGSLETGSRKPSGEAASHPGKGHAWVVSSAFAAAALPPGSLYGVLLVLILQEKKPRLGEVDLTRSGSQLERSRGGV